MVGSIDNSINDNIIDVNKPVENPNLKKALSNFIENRTESNALELGKQLNAAIYLIPILNDEMIERENNDGTKIIEKGSIIKFLNCFNDKNECYLPLFTDWSEIYLWTKQNVSTLIMPANDAWGFVNMIENDYCGAVINPGSTGWTLSKNHIKNLVEDSK